MLFWLGAVMGMVKKCAVSCSFPVYLVILPSLKI